MEDYDILLSAVDKLELTPEQKEAILKPAKAINTEIGKRGSDLLEVKKQLSSEKDKVTSYKEFSDLMAKFNMKAEDIRKAADSAGIQQTQDEKLLEYQNIIAEKDKKISENDKFIRVSKVKETLVPKFDEAVKNYKDSDGKGFNFLRDFTEVVSKELFEGIKEDDDDVIVNDRITKALEKAKTDQENFMKRNNLASVNSDIHRVDEKNLGGSGSRDVSGINQEEIHKKYVEGGQTTDAAARVIAAVRNARK